MLVKLSKGNMLFVATLAMFFQETLLLTLSVDDPPMGGWCHWPVHEGFHPDCGFRQCLNVQSWLTAPRSWPQKDNQRKSASNQGINPQHTA